MSRSRADQATLDAYAAMGVDVTGLAVALDQSAALRRHFRGARRPSPAEVANALDMIGPSPDERPRPTR